MKKQIITKSVAYALIVFGYLTKINAGEPPTPNWFFYWGQVSGTADAAHYRYSPDNTGAYAVCSVAPNGDWHITFYPPSKADTPVPPTGNVHINGFAAIKVHEEWHRDHLTHNFTVHGGEYPPLDCDVDGDGICNREPWDPPGFMDGGWEAMIGTDPQAWNDQEEGAEWAEMNAVYGHEKQDWAAPGSQKQSFLHAKPLSDPMAASRLFAKRLLPADEMGLRIGGLMPFEAKEIMRLNDAMRGIIQNADCSQEQMRDSLKILYSRLAPSSLKPIFWETLLRHGFRPDTISADGDDVYGTMAKMIVSENPAMALPREYGNADWFYGQWLSFNTRSNDWIARFAGMDSSEALEALLAMEDPREIMACTSAFCHVYAMGHTTAMEAFFDQLESRINKLAKPSMSGERVPFASMRFNALCQLGLFYDPGLLGNVIPGEPSGLPDPFIAKIIPIVRQWIEKGQKYPANYGILKSYHATGIERYSSLDPDHSSLRIR